MATDGPSNGVIFLDLNASDEYLSTVYENGLINIYGLKTKTKLESLKLDKNSTLARFHPTKRFHLSVASYTGSVYIYDMQSKRRIFRTTDSHGAPCRDLCTSPSNPDILLSVGYDCILNIFDIRRKLSPQQIRSNHPLSSVCISECGKYCVTGNLKGELISYDLRNLKECLECSLVHDSAVVRVGFVPSEEATVDVSNLEAAENILTETQNLPIEEASNDKQRRDSFLDFINCQSFRARESLGRRDSFNLQCLDRKNYDFDPRISVDGRSSLDARISMDLKSINDMLPDVADGGMHNTVGGKLKIRRSSLDCLLSEKRIKEKMRDDLIEEEDEVFEEQKSLDEKKLEESLGDNGVDKENILNISRKDINFLIKLPDDKNSTPNAATKRCSLDKDKVVQENAMVSSAELRTVLDEIKSLREEMNNRLKMLEFEVIFHADKNKSDCFMQNFNLWKSQMNVTEDIRSLLLSLVHADPFVTEFMKLQEENDRLKETINNLRKLR